MYGYKCPNCGANLDPGEKCDCKEDKADKKNIVTASTLFCRREYRGTGNAK